jgi:hypothetical protein
MTMFGGRESERLLSALFLNRYGGEAWKMLEPFLAALGRTELPFDLLEQVRKHEYPGYTDFEDGLPTVYYYFVPDAGWGSEHPPPIDPLDLGFVRSMDGFGLNFGCPLRLARAIEILEQLPAEAQRDCRHGLASSTKHLSTIEELLWFDAWNEPSARRRIPETTSKTFDWLIAFEDVSLRVECKFRPSDWPRLIDGPSHLLSPGALTKKAREQLGNAETGEINVLAVTGIAEVTDTFRKFCLEELEDAPNIGALVYQRFVGQMSVFSLNAEVASIIARKIPPQPAQPFQHFYFMLTNREEAARRQKKRESNAYEMVPTHFPSLTEIPVTSLPPRKYMQEPPLQYRCTLTQRLSGGEPLFENVPPYAPRN